MKIPVSLIITTYNNTVPLNLCLKSVAVQTVLPDEIIIGDDGSTDETRALIDEWRGKISVPIIHVWQEDQGFRASRIRNLAFAAAKNDYLVMIDGDIVLERHFIEDHQRLIKPNHFVCGSRIRMKKALSERYLQSGRSTLPLSWLPKDRFLNAVRCVPLSLLVADVYGQRPIDKGRSCNMSFWKSDIAKVNGFNEDFVGWGLEDSDFIARLCRAGVKKRFLKFGGIQYHLWHQERQLDNREERERLVQDVIDGKTPFFCPNGYQQHVKSEQASPACEQLKA